MEVNIRPISQADLPAVARLMEELGQTAGTQAALSLEAVTKMWNLMQGSPEVYLNLVAEVEGIVIGVASLLFYRSFLHRTGSAQINELVVASGWRGKGIGEKLVAACRQEAMLRGMDELEVGTEVDNLAAREFYRKAGFDQEYVLLGMELEG
jgi:ribosomal protein S18 acetylase RimI-like enzyme